MKIKHLIIVAAIILALAAGFSVWHREFENKAPTKTTPTSAPISKNHKTTSSDGPMMVTGAFRVEIASGDATKDPQADPRWQKAREESLKQQSITVKK